MAMKEAQKHNQPVIIVGMHRSGTSLIGAVVAKLGVNMGETAGSDLYNPTGYYEDLDFLRTNEGLLKELGGTWFNPPSRDRIGNSASKIQRAYSDLVEYRCGLWGVKDPRLSLFLPELLKVVENPKIIFCIRNEDQVIRSVTERDLLSKEATRRIKRRYDSDVILATQKFDSDSLLVIDYNDILSEPKETVTRISDFLGVKFNQIAADIVSTDDKLRKDKRVLLAKALRGDLRKAISNPSRIFRKQTLQRIEKYLRSAFRTIGFRR